MKTRIDFIAVLITKKNSYYLNSDSVNGNNKDFLAYFLHGIKLKSYEFNKYKSKKKFKRNFGFVTGSKNKPSSQKQLKFRH